MAKVGAVASGRLSPNELGGDRTEADRAQDSGHWERVARFYMDALSTTPGAADLWLQLGQALEATGKHAEAAFACREAERRVPRNR